MRQEKKVCINKDEEKQDEPEAELVVGDVSSEIEPKGKGKVDQVLLLSL
uniref:Uncharacterized protein n=1 Tax=Brassica oleracea TaxID=3712 RepID=A0A3P6ELF2_BRAOL|nr:unnamed protein product [Brassica oleracea]